MAITPVQLFGTDPGHLTDFSGLNIADIFNRIAVQRANSLEQVAGGLDDPEPEQQDALPPERPALAPRDLLSEEEPDLAPRQPITENPGIDSPALPQDGELRFPLGDEAGEAPGVLPPRNDIPGETDYSQPVAGSTRYDDPADFTFESEAQRGKDGRLLVYNPPEGDGGGAFEVAGITARYQPKEAARLRQMVESGDTAGAEAYAKDFYRKRAAPFTSKTENLGLRLQFADTVHHRGEGGLRRVLQRATGSDTDDYGELIGALSKDPAALDAFHRARQDYEWEEVDRGRDSRKKFRRGLQNRFDKAYQASRQH